MKKRLVASLLCAAMTASMVIGCGSQTNSDSQETSSSQKRQKNLQTWQMMRKWKILNLQRQSKYRSL